jgi:N-acetylneuraminic acid mutarotase
MKFYVLGGIDESNGASKAVEYYDIRNASWHSATEMHTARSRFASISFQDKVYVFGGLDVDPEGTYGNLASVECYDPATGSWEFRAPMSVPRHGHAAVLIDTLILVAGGYTESGQTGLLELYDPVRNTWKTLAPMPTARGFFGLAVADDLIYAIAGRVMTDSAPVEVYDPISNTWTVTDPLPDRVNRFACVSVENKIYLIGSEEFPRRVLIGN